MATTRAATRQRPARSGRPPARRPPARSGRPPARRKPARRPERGGSGRALLLVVLLVGVGVWLWHTRPEEGPSVLAGTCAVRGSDLTVTTEQAANAATIAAVARTRGLPPRATVIALATAQQESRLRNLDYGDRDSLGLFQQRPSQGWGSEAQVQDPVYAAGKFYDGLVRVPGWETGDLTLVADAVQRSAFPLAYRQWTAMAETLAGALYSTEAGALACAPSSAGGGDPAAVAAAATAALGVPASVGPDGVVEVDAAAGRPGGTWAVAQAERLGLSRVTADGWRWTPADGWTPAPGTALAPLRLEI
ncbi:hypothetical protein [Modestobacter sp. I12A-02662]|uniref:hypothetical protein n=1 Tax=Modestobacter sp. I12A-02662 TaxID=1730496 RepID=UPI0034DE0897